MSPRGWLDKYRDNRVSRRCRYLRLPARRFALLDPCTHLEGGGWLPTRSQDFVLRAVGCADPCETSRSHTRRCPPQYWQSPRECAGRRSPGLSPSENDFSLAENTIADGRFEPSSCDHINLASELILQEVFH